jgi:hypothetical protein
MPDGRFEFDQDIAKFETPGQACRQAVPEWPVFAHSCHRSAIIEERECAPEAM